MKHYMLDTNTVSFLLKKHPSVMRHVAASPISSLCISAITEGELLFGLAKRPGAKSLHRVVREFLRCVDVLPWDSVIAEHYGVVRADMVLNGKVLSPLDMLIAAHALAINMVLVTNDQAFSQVGRLHLEDWTM